MKEKLDFSSFSCGGDSWTRTNDPIDVNDVLYRLSHATTHRFEVPTKVSYRLSHATSFREQRALYHDEGVRSSSFFPEDTGWFILPGR